MKMLRNFCKVLNCKTEVRNDVKHERVYINEIHKNEVRTDNVTLSHARFFLKKYYV